MKIRKIYTLKVFAVVLMLFCFVSQNKAQKVSYKVIYDNPLSAPNLLISLDPFVCEAGDVGDMANIGFLLQADYSLFKRLAFNLSYTRAYLDLNARNNESVTGSTDNKLRPHSQIDAGLNFYFQDKIKEKKVNVNLKSVGNTGYSITIPAKVHCQTALRAGISYYNYPVQAEDNDYFIGKNTISGQSDTLDDNYKATGETFLQTNMNVIGGWVGIEWKRTANICVSADGYGVKSSSKISEFYMDFLTAGVVSFSDMTLQLKKPNASGSYVPDGPAAPYELSASPKRLIGGRIGWQYYLPVPDKFSFHFRVEMGQKPGWGTPSGFYLNCSAGITFGTSLKTIDKDSKVDAK